MYKNIFRGAAIGITETVPGVSGSTVAMILGIYGQLIYSLSSLTTDKRNEQLPFLLTFGIGMLFGFAVSLYLIDYLLSTYRTPTLLFFAGIITGFLPFLCKEAVSKSHTYFQKTHYFIIIFFFLLVAGGQFFGGGIEMNTTDLSVGNYLFLVLAGTVASTALVLPGISGALIMTILGVYEVATASVLTLHLPVILPILSGLILGVLFTSRLVRFLLEKYTMETYSAMIGLVAGSIIAVFHNAGGLMEAQVLIVSLLTFTAGLLLVSILKKVQNAG
ncbi:DUF368 domain-containing protein [Salipaludibacillus sp. CUR1]|uniref:DUF368 domain-containing protein n=1 Tax=Salipaludibacillus sp. CUR1 TaxID=2820003 RepID=UPI001E49A5FA|nr:DUF368 domain-containing protein [Salipaludibacillus sp. CUR1]MCE7791243.1 DUF368 domain-containing protein [Salipaludibacillus sp. CUR1]